MVNPFLQFPHGSQGWTRTDPYSAGSIRKARRTDDDSFALDSQSILIDCDHFPIGQSLERCWTHLTNIAADHQGRFTHGPKGELSHVFHIIHSTIPDSQHCMNACSNKSGERRRSLTVGIIPTARSSLTGEFIVLEIQWISMAIDSSCASYDIHRANHCFPCILKVCCCSPAISYIRCPQGWTIDSPFYGQRTPFRSISCYMSTLPQSEKNIDLPVWFKASRITG